MKGSVLKAALLGGILGGLLLSLPLLNIACCAWVFGIGGFSAWVLKSDSRGVAGWARCSFAGWLGGFLAGFAMFPLLGLWQRFIGDPEAHVRDALQGAEQFLGTMPQGQGGPSPEMVEAMMRGGMLIDVNVWSLVLPLFSGALISGFALFGGAVVAAFYGGPRGDAGTPAFAADPHWEALPGTEATAAAPAPTAEPAVTDLAPEPVPTEEPPAFELESAPPPQAPVVDDPVPELPPLSPEPPVEPTPEPAPPEPAAPPPPEPVAPTPSEPPNPLDEVLGLDPLEPSPDDPKDDEPKLDDDNPFGPVS
ncbi:MAG: hypothetical protein AAF533_12315 [Acidobacteriota bacterium]